MFRYSVISVNVDAALANEMILVGAAKLVVLSSDDPTATIRIDESDADELPARPTLEVCTESNDLIERAFITAAGTGGAGDTLELLAIFEGNATLYSP